MEKSLDDLIKETRDAAIAIYEDYQVLQDLSYRVQTSPADLRRASAILRRWLVDNQLGRVADPRVGRLQLMAIDNNPIYRAERKGGMIGFVSGGAVVHGVYIAAGTMNKGNIPVDFVNYHPDKLEAYTLKTFLNQRVIYSSGKWYTRLQVIKFVANVDNGVHGNGVREDWERQLSQIKQGVSVAFVEGPDGTPMPSIGWMIGSAAGDMQPAKYDPSNVNGVLLELISTLTFLVKSPSVVRLIEHIKAEIS